MFAWKVTARQWPSTGRHCPSTKGSVSFGQSVLALLPSSQLCHLSRGYRVDWTPSDRRNTLSADPYLKVATLHPIPNSLCCDVSPHCLQTTYLLHRFFLLTSLSIEFASRECISVVSHFRALNLRFSLVVDSIQLPVPQPEVIN